jgi:hypothetical protein
MGKYHGGRVAPERGVPVRGLRMPWPPSRGGGSAGVAEFQRMVWSGCHCPGRTNYCARLWPACFCRSHARQQLEAITHPRIGNCGGSRWPLAGAGNGAGRLGHPAALEVGAEKEFAAVLWRGLHGDHTASTLAVRAAGVRNKSSNASRPNGRSNGKWSGRIMSLERRRIDRACGASGTHPLAHAQCRRRGRCSRRLIPIPFFREAAGIRLLAVLTPNCCRDWSADLSPLPRDLACGH